MAISPDSQLPVIDSSSPSVPKETDRAMNGAVSDEGTPAGVEPTTGQATSSPSNDLVDTTSNVEPPASDDKVTEKHENGSLSTTLTATNPHHSAASRRKGQVSTTSDEQPSSTSHATKEKVLPVRRPSLLSRFFRKIVPCIPSQPSPQPVSSDHPQKDDSTTPLPPSKEKPPVPAPEQSSSNGASALVDAPSTANGTTKEGLASSLAPLDMTPPPRVTDSDIILPPTPTSHLLPQAETEGMTSGAVVPPGATGTINKRHSHVPTTNGDGDESEGTSFTEEEDPEDLNNVDELEDEEDRLIMNGGAGIPIGPDGNPKPLLPPIAPNHVGRKCLVLDLDETLVHSSFKSLPQADYVVPVEIEYHWHNVYVIKRPGVDNFLKKMGELYEVVVFTASLSKYADPVLDKLDIHQVVKHRLFRESCYNHRGNYVKDLSQLGRPIADTIILDNSPASYIFHPNNAVPVSSWFNDPHDTELTDLVPFLADLGDVPDVRGVLDGAR